MIIAQTASFLTAMVIGALIVIITLLIPIYLLIIGWVGRRRSARCARISFLLGLMLSIAFLTILLVSGASSHQEAPPWILIGVVLLIANTVSIFLVRESSPKNNRI